MVESVVEIAFCKFYRGDGDLTFLLTGAGGVGGVYLRLYVFFHHEGDFKDGPGRRRKPPLRHEGPGPS